MKASELVGKLAIRTEPVLYPRAMTEGGSTYDYSYTSTPIEIVKVTQTHIVYKSNGDHLGILNKRWIDDNWIDYNELIEGVENVHHQ